MGELTRKLLHISGTAIPLIAIRLGHETVLYFAALLSVVYVFHEFLDVGAFDPIKRGDGHDFAPLIYGFSVSTLLLLPLEPEYAYAAIEVLAVGDGLASIAGRNGHRSLPMTDKTLEGSAACLAGGLAGALLFLDPLSAIGCAVAGTVAEAYLEPDNLWVPITAYLAAFTLAFVP